MTQTRCDCIPNEDNDVEDEDDDDDGVTGRTWYIQLG